MPHAKESLDEGPHFMLAHQPSVTQKDPQECLDEGIWQVEPIYYYPLFVNHSNGARPQKRGKAYKCLESGDYVCFESFEGHVYNVGDNVYLDAQQPELAYHVCGIVAFKLKREILHVKVSWYYRTCEIPDVSYNQLLVDREEELKEHNASTAFVHDSRLKNRELFISEAHDVYSVSTLRGKCAIQYCKDISTADKQFALKDDAFFYILSYSPETYRLASIQGEIRIGASHQAKLPECREKPSTSSSPSTFDRIYEFKVEDENDTAVDLMCCDNQLATCSTTSCTQWEAMVWQPDRLPDSELKMFIQAVRSMAAFKTMSVDSENCLGGMPDNVLIKAYDTLHTNSYVKPDSLNAIINSPPPPTVLSQWSEEEAKKFVKGLKQFGKNFFKIRKEMLHYRSTSELVEYYYLWKRTTHGVSQRPRTKQRRANNQVLRRIKPSASANGLSNSKASSTNDFFDPASASEHEDDEEDYIDTRDLTGYACHHCYTQVSKDWHHASKDRALLCTDCRVYYKKYGEMRLTENRASTPPEHMFSRARTVAGVKTRACKKDKISRTRGRTMTPTLHDDGQRNSASPTSSSTSSNEQTNGDVKANGSNGNHNSNGNTPSKRRKKRRRGWGEARKIGGKKIKVEKSPAVVNDSDEPDSQANDDEDSQTSVIQTLDCDNVKKEEEEEEVKEEVEEIDVMTVVPLADAESIDLSDGKTSSVDGQPPKKPYALKRVLVRRSGVTCSRTDVVFAPDLEHELTKKWVAAMHLRREKKQRKDMEKLQKEEQAIHDAQAQQQQQAQLQHAQAQMQHAQQQQQQQIQAQQQHAQMNQLMQMMNGGGVPQQHAPTMHELAFRNQAMQTAYLHNALQQHQPPAAATLAHQQQQQHHHTAMAALFQQQMGGGASAHQLARSLGPTGPQMMHQLQQQVLQQEQQQQRERQAQVQAMRQAQLEAQKLKEQQERERLARQRQQQQQEQLRQQQLQQQQQQQQQQLAHREMQRMFHMQLAQQQAQQQAQHAHQAQAQAQLLHAQQQQQRAAAAAVAAAAAPQLTQLEPLSGVDSETMRALLTQNGLPLVPGESMDMMEKQCKLELNSQTDEPTRQNLRDKLDLIAKMNKGHHHEHRHSHTHLHLHPPTSLASTSTNGQVASSPSQAHQHYLQLQQQQQQQLAQNAAQNVATRQAQQQLAQCEELARASGMSVQQLMEMIRVQQVQQQQQQQQQQHQQQMHVALQRETDQQKQNEMLARLAQQGSGGGGGSSSATPAVPSEMDILQTQQLMHDMLAQQNQLAGVIRHPNQ